MKETKKEFKAGQKWKNRCGDIIEIAFVDNSKYYTVTGTDGYTWNLEGLGLIGEESNFDLVELIEDVSSEEKQDNKHTVAEVVDALYRIIGDNYSCYIPDIEEYLSKTKDPEYQKYLELKAKFE